MTESVILDACNTGNWERAARWSVERAHDEFQDFRSSGELEEFDDAAMWVRLDQFFQPMKDSIDDALSHYPQSTDDCQWLKQFGKVYDKMLTAARTFPEHIARDKLKVSMTFRDVLVVECIRVAGTHSDQDKFDEALQTAVGRDVKSEENLRSQLHHSYHRLLSGAPGKWISGSKLHRGPRPAKGRARQESSTSRGAAMRGRSSSARTVRSTSARSESHGHQRRASHARRVHIQIDGAVDSESKSAGDRHDSDRGSRPRAPPGLVLEPRSPGLVLQQRIAHLEWKAERADQLELECRAARAELLAERAARLALEQRVAHMEQRMAQLEAQSALHCRPSWKRNRRDDDVTWT